MSPLTRSKALAYAEFRSRLVQSNCQLCPLGAQRTNIVPDRGNPDASIMVIGEAPGESEDLAGRAFVGRAGKLLDALMKQAGIDTERETLIVNIVKCRPPDNRRPTPEEAHSCRPYLDKQFEIASPRYVLLLGATAVKHIAPGLSKAPLSSLVGRFFTLEGFAGIEFMVLYHPAFMLRDRRKESAMLEHLRNFKKCLNLS